MYFIVGRGSGAKRRLDPLERYPAVQTWHRADRGIFGCRPQLRRSTRQVDERIPVVVVRDRAQEQVASRRRVLLTKVLNHLLHVVHQ